MKRMCLSCLLLSIMIQLSAQYADTTAHKMTNDYLRKSKNQRTAGWILLGGGAIMTLIGSITAANEVGDELVNLFDPAATHRKNAGTGATIVAMTGVLSMVGSIPLFIASGKNRRKAAAELSFKLENSTQVRQIAFSSNLYPAIRLQIKL